MLDLRILGPLEVTDSGEIITIPGRKARTLLACLIANGGNPVSRDRLIDSIWGESPPKSAVNTLHTYVTHLRTALDGKRVGVESSVIGTHPSGYQLHVQHDQVDSWRLEEAVASARIHSDRREFAEAADSLRTALEQWRGPALEEFLDSDFAQAESGRLAELRLNAEELRAVALVESDQAEEAVSVLERLVDEYPYRERLWEHLMLALYRAGRQTDALHAYRRLQNELAEIGLEPGRDVTLLEGRILEDDPLLDPPRAEPTAVLGIRRTPQPADTFVGRIFELAELKTIIEGSRLVTITGMGGTGKSRLGIQLVLQLGMDDRYVDLSGADREAVATARMAEAFGLTEGTATEVASQIARRIGNERLVLLVDNAEDSVSFICPTITELVGSCQGLRVVVTSREPIGVQGERVYPIRPLPVGVSTEAADAETLFMARARLASPMTEEQRQAVAEICLAVNGMPAAIEVVAAAGDSLSLREIAENLSALIDTDDRHSIPAALQWTHDALTVDQQRMFTVASLFPGGVTFDALTAIAEPNGERRDQLGNLSRLVSRSLLIPDAGTPRRFRVLEVFRRLVLDWPADSAQTRIDATRFIRYFVELAEELELSFGTDRWQAMLERVDADEVNLSHAIEQAVEIGDAASAYRIAGPLGRYWRWRGRSIEGAAKLELVLRTSGVGTPETAKAEREMAATLRVLGRFDESRRHAARALDLYESVKEDRGVADSLYDMALADIFLGEYATAQRLLQRSAGIWTDLGEFSLRAFPMIPLAWLHMIRGEYETAEAMWTSLLTNVDTALFPEHSGITFRVAELALAQGQVGRARTVAIESLQTAIRARYPYHEAGARTVLASVLMAEGDTQGAVAEAELALNAARESGNAEGSGQALLLLGRLALQSDDVAGGLRILHQFLTATSLIGGPLIVAILAEFAATIEVARYHHIDAARLHGAAEAVRDAHRLPLNVLDSDRIRSESSSLRSALGAADFESAFEEGTAWGASDVLDLVGRWFD